MKTTVLFVEILIGGIQTTIWNILIILSICGYEWIQMNTTTEWLGLTVFIFTIFYTLGILFDRLWQYLLRNHTTKLRKEYFGNENDRSEFLKIRTYIFLKSEKLAESFDYARSRMRIARASFFNFILIAVTSFFFILIKWDNIHSTLRWGFPILTIMSVPLAMLAYYAWKTILEIYFEQILTAYEIISGSMNISSK